MIDQLIQLVYLVATALFIFSLKWMSDPATARRGVFAGVGGMVLAVVGTLMHPLITVYSWIVIPLALGTLAGIPLSWVPLTAVPQRTALSHAFGGLAAGLVGYCQILPVGGARRADHVPDGRDRHRSDSGVPDVHGKPRRRRKAAGGGTDVADHLSRAERHQFHADGTRGCHRRCADRSIRAGRILFPALIVLALVFGVLLVLPIGGADMPTVISLLNSYAGLAAVAMGFVMENKLLITAGALDGASGLILSIVMCKAMNRSFSNVLFGAFGQVQAVSGEIERRTAKSATAEDAAQILENASTVVVIPGYGMAVSQAQHRVHDLYEELAEAGRRCEVRHPSRRGPHAGPHERAAGRGRDSLRPPRRNGRHQSRDAAV